MWPHFLALQNAYVIYEWSPSFWHFEIVLKPFESFIGAIFWVAIQCILIYGVEKRIAKFLDIWIILSMINLIGTSIMLIINWGSGSEKGLTEMFVQLFTIISLYIIAIGIVVKAKQQIKADSAATI